MERSTGGARLWRVPEPEERALWGDFPLGVYPAWVRTWVEQASEELQMSVDMAALTQLGVTAGAIGKAMQVWANPQWHEWPNLWTAAVLGPGEGKSPLMRRFSAPIADFERRQEDSYAQRLEEWYVRAEELAGREENLEGEAREVRKRRSRLWANLALETNQTKRAQLEAQLAALDQKLATLEKQLAETRKDERKHTRDRPIARRVRVNDVTPVGLKRFLHENRGQALVLDSEAAFLDNIGRHGAQALTTYQAAEGNDDLDYERGNSAKTRVSFRVRAPALSLAVMPQPHVLETLARMPGWKERGGAARMLVAYGESRAGSRNTSALPMEKKVEAQYMFQMLRLLTWCEALVEPIDLTLSSAAQLEFSQFRAQHEREMRAGARLGDDELRAWGNKVGGRVLKIALILHVLHYLHDAPDDFVSFSENFPTQIEKDRVEQAIAVIRFIIPQQIFAFEMMSGGRALGDARRILHWARQVGRKEFSGREARRTFSKAVQASLECNARLGAAIALLLSTECIERKEDEDDKPKGGRPHSPVYIISKWEIE